MKKKTKKEFTVLEIDLDVVRDGRVFVYKSLYKKVNRVYSQDKKLIATKGIYQTRVNPTGWLISSGSRRLKFRYGTPAPGRQQTSRECAQKSRGSIRLDFIPFPSVPVNQVTCHLPEYVMYRINIRATHTVTHGRTRGGRRNFFSAHLRSPSPLPTRGRGRGEGVAEGAPSPSVQPRNRNPSSSFPTFTRSVTGET